MGSLEVIQTKRESSMIELGIARFREGINELKNRSEGANVSSSSRKLLIAALPEATPYLEEFATSLLANTKSTHKRAVLHGVLAVGPEASVALGLKVCLQGISNSRPLASIAHDVGREVQVQLWASRLRNDDPVAFSRIFRQKRLKRRKKVLKGSAIEREYEQWEYPTLLRVGMFIINCLLKTTGLFRVTKVDRGKVKGWVRLLELSEEAAGSLKEMEDTLALCKPLYAPMVVSPRLWTSFEGGPYLTDAANLNCTLVRKASSKGAIDAAIESGTMQPCLDALNAVQSTPYRINKRILEVVEWAWNMDLGGHIKKLPKATQLEMPEIPEDAHENEAKRIRAERLEIGELNRAIVASAVSYHTVINEAKELAKYEAFYLPHNMDFRGRVYPIPHFNHQREDYVSALFEFSDGVPIGESGGKWLSHSLSSTGEFEEIHKRSLHARGSWAESNSEWLCEIARDPYTNTGWINAAKPFKFLAACFEWEAWVVGGQRVDYSSRLPISLDGSNSGIQHYSAALRSPRDAKLVNLTNTTLPEDLYSAVSKRVVERLQETTDRSEEASKFFRSPKDIGRQWLNYGVTRSTVKRQVMTYAYSSEKYGFSQQIDSDLMKPLRDECYFDKSKEHPFGTYIEQQEACRYLALLIWGSIQEVLEGASKGMRYFKWCAKVTNLAGLPIRWANPVGFPVVQKYTKDKAKQVELHVYNEKIPLRDASPRDLVDTQGNVFERVRMNMQTPINGTINTQKQQNAVSPNIIHSLDAAHLLKVALASSEEGINSLMMIHDSFATHAGNTERFFQIIREQFVEMYENYDVFEEIKEANIHRLPEDIQPMWPIPPQKGDFDIRSVLDSPYSFS